MKQFAVEIEKLVVDAASIAPLHGEQFRSLVEQALQQRLKNHGVPSPVTPRETVSVSLPPVGAHEHAGGVQLARHVAQAIHHSLTRKA